MSTCAHDDCDRQGIALWNGRHFCDEHVRERLRTTADHEALKRIRQLEDAIVGFWKYTKFVLPMPVAPAVGRIMRIGREIEARSE